MSDYTAILGMGIHVPSRLVTNDELAPLIDSTDEWIVERTGIHQRYYVAQGETNSGLAAEASREALSDAGIDASEIDAIIFATLSPDTAFPGSGVYLQQHLGMENIPALDVRAQCSGFLYGLSIADAWIRAGVYKHVLLVGSEVHSTALDFSEAGRDVTALFGDGAGAAVLGPSSKPGLKWIALGADGSGASLLTIEAPGSSRHPSLDHETISQGKHFPVMHGRSVFRKAVEKLSAELEFAIERCGAPIEEIVFVPHQANQRIIDMVAHRLKIPNEQFVSTIGNYGNTTAASIPISLYTALREEIVRPGTPVIMCAFGSGLTWATAEVAF